ncbi:PHB depolymerase family esterase [Paraburkholderia mimosarum]|uniref:extracellular catalytic domain type 2 short-chain-length polyhydroxyalkanoate depolymerase n=1 Tax=Paraburkholderia mimosarum TaxID=312026 RepID=UPI00056758B6|nr:PHB depolymerase family esterase [Paraburkholderia mimosarum]
MHSFICTGGRKALRMVGLLATLSLSPQLGAQVVSLPAFNNVDIKETSVSGLSAGGFMAVDFDVAYSSIIKGAGIIAGGPYYCSRGDVNTATTICSCTGLPFFSVCKVGPGGTNVQQLINVTDQNAASGTVDPTANLANQKIWMFSGTADTLVPQPVMVDLENYYRHYINSGNIQFKKNVAAQHAMPTDFFGNPCSNLGTPYINNCNFDAAGELLKWIYGSNLNPKNTGTLGGRFVEFDQSEFIDDHNPTAHGMANSGFLYVPADCEKNANQPCRLHVVFHGCLQDPSNIQDKFVKNAGYNKWADTNRILVLYPQAAAKFPNNPNACWNWFDFDRDDPNFARKSGRQMLAVKHMIDRIAGSNPSPPQGGNPTPSQPQCFTANNFDHVRAGRAHDSFFVALANGSNETMGPDNVFITVTLKQTGANFYVVGTCP